MTKTCAYGTCNSDQHYAGKREDMNEVRFIPFPKPKTKLDKCLRWIKSCGRQNFRPEQITKHTYVCTKHFVGGNGPTEEYPDPIPEGATDLEKKSLPEKEGPARPKGKDRRNSGKEVSSQH